MTVDRDVRDVIQKTRRTITPRREVKQLRVLVNETSRVLARAELRMSEKRLQKNQVRRHAANAKLAQRAGHPVYALRLARRPRRHLLKQRVIMTRHHRARIRRAAVKTNAETRRAAIRRDASVVGNELVERVLGRDAALQRMTVQTNLVLRRHAGLAGNAEASARRDLYLRLHNVNARHLLGDRMLNLNARIDLNEIKLAAVGVLEKLGGAGVFVARVPRKTQRERRQCFARNIGKIRRRRALNNFLIATLHGTVAFKQVKQGAVFVAEQLDFHMARALNEALKVDRAVAEGCGGFAASGGDAFGEFGGGVDASHAASAAAPGCFEHQGVAEGFGERL